MALLLGPSGIGLANPDVETLSAEADTTQAPPKTLAPPVSIAPT